MNIFCWCFKKRKKNIINELEIIQTVSKPPIYYLPTYNICKIDNDEL